MSSIVRVCRLCKEPMKNSPFMMCPDCLIESDKVRSFIAKNPLVSLTEISQSTNVPHGKIREMVKLGISKKNSYGTGMQ
ncbi:hypothetical protein [Virgibacillus sediminis]|uniref:Flagellar protein n=1 Tax=Virgibacillus sediminis TaxID=202260 RepID=A0ABV7A4V6_9BACI